MSFMLGHMMLNNIFLTYYYLRVYSQLTYYVVLREVMIEVRAVRGAVRLCAI